MAKVIGISVVVRRADGAGISQDLFDKIIRKVTTLCERLGCKIDGKWRLGEPPEVEDLLG